MELLLSNGQRMVPVEVTHRGKKLSFAFPFDRVLKEEVKCMRGARFVPESKTWEVTDCRRNWMQIESLQSDDGVTYNQPKELARYRAPRLGVKPSRECAMPHQASMLDFGASTRCCIWAAEQGVGKTLSAVELMEWAASQGFTEWWYVAPLRVLTAVRLELEKWKCKVQPRLLNYDILERELEDKFQCRSCGERDVPLRNTWTKAKVLKHGDGCGPFVEGKCEACGWYEGQVESAYPRCKSCGAATGEHENLWRSQPKAPAPHGVIFDESSRLKNGGADRTKAAQQLADDVRAEHDGFVIEMTGTPAPHDPGDWHSQAEIVCPGLLRESTRAHLERRCAVIEKQDLGDGRAFPKIVSWIENEVKFLYERLKPVTEIHMAKDVLELPELTKEIIRLPVSEEVERAARLAAQSSINAAQALNRLRQLSDGFQYGGVHMCSDCEGMGNLHLQGDEEKWVECHACGGGGFVQTPDGIRRAPGPKDDRLRTDLELNLETGRLVVYAGYHASVDLCTQIAQEEGWNVLQCDGRGWKWFMLNGSNEYWDEMKLLKEMDLGTRSSLLDRLCLVGHPKSVGLGQNLTAARENIFFSNDFDAESRWQAEKRTHRNGQTRGVRIKDYCHIATDEFVLRNLDAKRALQSITLGEVLACL